MVKNERFLLLLSKKWIKTPREKKPPVFSPNFGSLLVFFSGNFLKYRAISKIFPETSRKIPADIRRVHSVFFPWKKNEKVLILLFFLLFSRNILWNFSKFQGAEFFINVEFFYFFSGNFGKLLKKYREIKGIFFLPNLEE